MLRELAHFVAHAPATLALRARSTPVDLYETLMERAESRGLGDARAALVKGLAGDVLEIGCGTGLSFPRYEPGVRLVAIEPDDAFRAVAEERAKGARCHVRIERGSAMTLPYDDASFDAVVFQLVLCSVEDVGRALAEVARVLRPRGEVRAIEHVRSPRPLVGLAMRALDPFWVALNRMGCHMSRDTEASFAAAGFVLREVASFDVFSPGLPAFPFRRIVATRSRA